MKSLFNNKFLTSSFLMLLGANLYNFGQFVFHFLAGRFLGKALYGDLASLISILGIVGIIQLIFGLTIVKFISTQKKNQVNFTRWVYWWTLWAGAFLTGVLFLVSPIMAKFLNLSQPGIIFLLPPTAALYLITTAGRSILQGFLKFKAYVFSLLSESVVKIVLTLIFGLLGFAIWGLMSALLIGIASSFIITRISLKEYVAGKRDARPELKSLIQYSSATLIQGIALTSMYSMDLILVKHFFSSSEAGIYAAVAILGRIVFFAGTPVNHVMFPMVARRHSQGESYMRILYLSLILILAVSLLITVFYSVLPNLAINILYGSSYLPGAPLLWWYGLFMSFLSLAMLFVQFFLSIGKVRIVGFFALAPIFQVLLIWFFHNDLLTVIKISVLITALLDVALFVYFFYLKYEKETFISNNTGLQTRQNNQKGFGKHRKSPK